MTTTTAQRYAAKLAGTCVYGHDITDDENVYFRPLKSGGVSRQCRECRRRTQATANDKARERVREEAQQPGVTLLSGADTRAATGDHDWHAHAECDGADLDAFFLRDDERGIPQRARDAAGDYCKWCPVRRECGDDATATRSHGLWGGAWRDRHPKANRYRIRNLIGDDQ
ncbi:WhiB family transcriptional regulator [Saccharopolyspora taberi]|uniref:4Fe-4S Wbl-type domain-containing protein n=1 Tax=Saccharopolyspora taberi TaxID=60895 RepID=A0ABN3V000_9PSEU